MIWNKIEKDGYPPKDGNYLVIIKRGWGDNTEMVYFYKNNPGNENWYGCRDYPITHWMELPKHPDPKHYSNLLDPISVEINRM